MQFAALTTAMTLRSTSSIVIVFIDDFTFIVQGNQGHYPHVRRL